MDRRDAGGSLTPAMELRLYDRPGPRPAEPHPWLQPPGWWRRVVEGFESWAAPEAEPELKEEQERSLTPVAVLLGLALLGQAAQYWVPAVHAYLEERDVLYRAAWAGFTIFKQLALFALMLGALRIKEDSLGSLGFPRLDARRLTLALGLVGFFLGAALLHRPGFPETDVLRYWDVPYWAGERLLWVGLGLTAAVVEETFFRGFAIVWLYRWSGHLPLAVIFPAVIFASGHIYLGWTNVAFALAAALVFSLVFLWRRDLYWVMVVHFIVDALLLLY